MSKEPIKMHSSVPEDFVYPDTDRSFIVVLDRMLMQALDNVRKHDPSVESQTLDAAYRERIYTLQEVIKAYKEFK